MLGDVLSDVGNRISASLSTSFSRCSDRFHTGAGSKVEIFEVVPEAIDPGSESGIFRDRLLDLFETVDDRRVITPPESIANFHQLGGEQLTCQIHRYLARCGEGFGSRFRPETIDCDSPLFCHCLLNGENGE